MKSSTQQAKKLMIMAAGTGGHIFPGLAIAEEMKQRGWSVSWLGTKHGMEAEIVPKFNIEIDQIDFAGMRGKGLLHTLKGCLKLINSFFTSWKILSQRKPDVVLGMGGYVTFPGGIVAALRSKPLVLMNADAGLLLSNKLLRPFARKILFGLPPEQSHHNNDELVTGNAIRKDIAQIESPAVRYANRNNQLNVLVVGGSLGAKVLNETIPAALALLSDSERPHITHQSGKAHIGDLKKRYSEFGVQAEIVDFINDMPARYAQTDLVICRAGAITVSELNAAGVASVLIPLIASSTSHQVDNARWMAKQGAAIYLPQAELSAETLAGILRKLTRQQCQKMAEAAYQVGQRDAGNTIANVIEELT